METRKLQQVGGGTYTVSIPKSWAEDQGLEAGTEVTLYTHADGSIVVRSSERDAGALETVTIDVPGTEPASVRRALAAAHVVGFESVRLRPETSFTEEQCRAARSAVHSLVGTDVLAARDDEIRIQNLLDSSGVSVSQTVVQLQFIALSIHREATAAFVDGDGDARDRLGDRIDEAGRQFDLVTRYVNRALVSFEAVDRLGTSRPALFDYYATARELERVADAGASIARLSTRSREPIPDRTRAEFERMAATSREIVESATVAVLEGADGTAAHETLDRRDDLGDAIDSLTAHPGVTGPLRQAIDALRRTADHGGRIGTVALRSSLRAE